MVATVPSGLEGDVVEDVGVDRGGAQGLQGARIQVEGVILVGGVTARSHRERWGPVAGVDGGHLRGCRGLNVDGHDAQRPREDRGHGISGVRGTVDGHLHPIEPWKGHVGVRVDHHRLGNLPQRLVRACGLRGPVPGQGLDEIPGLGIHRGSTRERGRVRRPLKLRFRRHELSHIERQGYEPYR